MARFGMNALLPAAAIAARFRDARTRALFAGLAAHSFLAFDQPLSGALGMMMAIPAHAVGWPIPRGGAQKFTDALCSHLSTLGGKVMTSSRIESLESLPGYDLILCDLSPSQLLRIADKRLSDRYKRQLQGFRYGPGCFKID